MTKRRGMPPTDEAGHGRGLRGRSECVQRAETVRDGLYDARRNGTHRPFKARSSAEDSTNPAFTRATGAHRPATPTSGRGRTARYLRSMRRGDQLCSGWVCADMRGSASCGVRRRHRRHVFGPARGRPFPRLLPARAASSMVSAPRRLRIQARARPVIPVRSHRRSVSAARRARAGTARSRRKGRALG
jgi:hypothetical protein